MAAFSQPHSLQQKKDQSRACCRRFAPWEGSQVHCSLRMGAGRGHLHLTQADGFSPVTWSEGEVVGWRRHCPLLDVRGSSREGGWSPGLR